MKKLLLLGIMLLGMGGVNSNISAAPALKIGKEFTSVASLEGKSFAIVKDGKLIYNTTDYNLGYGTLSDAISASNNGYLFKIESLASNADEDIRDCYLLRGLKGDGTQYNIWGNPPYFQSQKKDGANCCFYFALGENMGMDAKYTAVWSIEYVAEKGFTLLNKGTGKYYNDPTKDACSDTPGYFKFCAIEEDVEPISLFNSDNFIEIPQKQEETEGGVIHLAPFVAGDGYTQYTTTNQISVVFKMLNVNVKDYDYILFKFAEPVPDGLRYAFWNGTDSKELPAGVKGFKYVFAADAGCAINSEGIIPQISIISIDQSGKIVKVAGVYGHKASAPADTRTFSCDKALDFTDVEGLKAYAITGFNPANATLTLTQVYKVPANTGLYLEGTGGEYKVPVIESASAIAGNMLVASGDGNITQTSGENTNLVLAKTSKGRGFHPLSSDGNMGTNKAYLQLPTSDFNSIAEASLRFVFEDDEATGIEEVATPIVADGVWYTINGVKLAGEPTEKGIYIFNGKKVAIQ